MAQKIYSLKDLKIHISERRALRVGLFTEGRKEEQRASNAPLKRNVCFYVAGYYFSICDCTNREYSQKKKNLLGQLCNTILWGNCDGQSEHLCECQRTSRTGCDGVNPQIFQNKVIFAFFRRCRSSLILDIFF